MLIRLTDNAIIHLPTGISTIFYGSAPPRPANKFRRKVIISDLASLNYGRISDE
ncbi:hypothetical protein CEV33_0289 [Brucella grignonensis]|uniref:Uncharacterized protein n=1 Tax=Brucella grignonensis TaxID=94627 RepID=A0A256FK88_9HYPH|nr:hypothetical protein CEV33_0289 [Brucella grignonensis]